MIRLRFGVGVRTLGAGCYRVEGATDSSAFTSYISLRPLPLRPAVGALLLLDDDLDLDEGIGRHGRDHALSLDEGAGRHRRDRALLLEAGAGRHGRGRALALRRRSPLSRCRLPPLRRTRDAQGS